MTAASDHTPFATVEPKVGEALNALLLIEHGLSEPMATRTSKQWTEKCDQIAALQSRVAELEKGLAPFASALAGIPTNLPDQFEILLKIDAIPFARLTIGEFRRALSSMEQSGSSHG